jgi:hypothetical protein
MSVEYAIIIKNKTRLETLIERFNTKAQAKFSMIMKMKTKFFTIHFQKCKETFQQF